MPDYEVVVYFGAAQQRMVNILASKGEQPKVTQHGEADSNEHAAIHCIVEVIRCLALQQNIGHYFNPAIPHTDTGEEVQEYVKCQWTRSGKLFCAGPADKRFMHADNLEEALARNRTFTCTRRLYDMLPKKRPRTARSPSRKTEDHPSWQNTETENKS